MKKNGFEAPAIETESIESLSSKLLAVTAELAAANRELRQVQKEREQMLANISHDLRAPITAIRSSLDYLKSGQTMDIDDFRSALSTIDRRTTTLEHLIQDMYYLFCVEDTSRELQYESIEVLPFFETYYYDLLANSFYDQHELLLDIPESMHVTISIDVQKIIRVMDNLLTNAAKYSGEGSTITLKVEEASRENSSDSEGILVHVIDNGIGIPPESIPYLFKRTYTVSSSRTPNSATGSGLGLSIAQAIIQRHGGSITCRSKLGEGSCFSIYLPRHCHTIPTAQ